MIKSASLFVFSKIRYNDYFFIRPNEKCCKNEFSQYLVNISIMKIIDKSIESVDFDECIVYNVTQKNKIRLLEVRERFNDRFCL